MAQFPSGTGSQPLRSRSWLIVVGGLAVIGLGGALIGGLTDDPGASAAAASPSRTTAAPSAAPSTTTSQPVPSTTTPPTTTPSTAAAVPTASTPASLPATTTAAPTSAGVDFVMPDLVGADLQSAQNAVQELGVLYSASHDLLGSRNQIIDSNWIVCGQNVAPGQRVTGDAEGALDFGVVKREERCP